MIIPIPVSRWQSLLCVPHAPQRYMQTPIQGERGLLTAYDKQQPPWPTARPLVKGNEDFLILPLAVWKPSHSWAGNLLQLLFSLSCFS